MLTVSVVSKQTDWARFFCSMTLKSVAVARRATSSPSQDAAVATSEKEENFRLGHNAPRFLHNLGPISATICRHHHTDPSNQ